METKILLIENKVESAKLYIDALESSLNVSVFHAKNEKEALNIIEDELIKVAIIDQRLDNNELGTDIFKKITKRRKDIVAILLSAVAENTEVGEAMQMGFYTFINKLDGIASLPETVVDAIHKYDKDLIKNNTDRNKELLGSFRLSKLSFSKKMKVYRISRIAIDMSYIFEDDWKEIASIDAGKTYSETETYTYEKEIKFENKTLIETLNKSSITMKKLPITFKNDLSVKLNTEFRTLFSSRFKSESSIQISMKLPDIPTDTEANYLINKSYQIAQVYKKYLYLMRLDCPFCNTPEIIPLKVFIPTNKIGKRQVDSYKNGKIEILNTIIVKK